MYDVVISGAGPNGLMLACELALGGTRPLVIEKLSEPSEEQRANGMVGQVIKLMHRRGLLERLTGSRKPPDPAARFMFAAFPLPLSDLPDNPVYTVLVPQRRIEAVLAERAAELGVEVRRGHEVTGMAQKDDRVLVEVDHEQIVEARFLVGADGGKSITRKLAGVEFPGVTQDRTVSRMFDVDIPRGMVDRQGLNIPGYGHIPAFQHHRTERGLFSFAPFPDGRRMMVASTRDIPEPDAPYTFEEFREAVNYVLGVDVAVTEPRGPHTKRRLSGGNTRLAEHYRAGRVLLVGDAAHVHSAIGGPGLNLGLQDAVNLGWKLAATVRGTAPGPPSSDASGSWLLDTYHEERHPVGASVLHNTRAQSALLAPGPHVDALRDIFGDLMDLPEVNTYLSRLLSGVAHRYPMPYPVTHPLVGLHCPPGIEGTDVLLRPDGVIAWAGEPGAAPDPEGRRRARAAWGIA